MTTVTPALKPSKGQFRCFKCRQLFPQKEGKWHHWETMEVHLCKLCERKTKDSPERHQSRDR